MRQWKSLVKRGDVVGSIKREREWAVDILGRRESSEHTGEAETYSGKERGLVFLLYPDNVLFLFDVFLRDY